MPINKTRTFSADVGDKSIGSAGPDAIERDIDNMMTNQVWNDEVIKIGNMEEYEPTLDYEPATKKYVDLHASVISHAVETNDYGLSTPDLYGHTKVIDEATQSEHTDGEALSTYGAKLLNDKIEALTPVLINSIDITNTGVFIGNYFTEAYNLFIVKIYGTLEADNDSSSAQSFKLGIGSSTTDTSPVSLFINWSVPAQTEISGEINSNTILRRGYSEIHQNTVWGTFNPFGDSDSFRAPYISWYNGGGTSLTLTADLTAEIYGIKIWDDFVS